MLERYVYIYIYMDLKYDTLWIKNNVIGSFILASLSLSLSEFDHMTVKRFIRCVHSEQEVILCFKVKQIYLFITTYDRSKITYPNVSLPLLLDEIVYIHQS